MSRRFLLAAEMLERAKHALERLRAFPRQPGLELFADSADVDAFEQLTAIERDRLVVTGGGERIAQCEDIAPQLRAVDHRLVVAAADEHVLAERQSELVERVSQGPTPRKGVELGPEDGKERVAPMKPVGATGHISKKRKALGLREHRARVALVGSFELSRAKKAQSEHRLPEGTGIAYARQRRSHHGGRVGAQTRRIASCTRDHMDRDIATINEHGALR